MKLHPLSVPYRGLSRAVSLGSAAFFLGVFGAGAGPLDNPLVIVPLVVLAFLAGFAWEAAYYRRFEYELTEDTLDIASGVISRRQRDIPLGRIQNVDISRNVVQRVLGIAVVEFETAGGESAEAVLRFVDYDEAKRLQRDLRRRKEGLTGGTGPHAERTGTPTEGMGEFADEEVAETGDLLFALSNAELLLLSGISLNPRILLPLVFVVGPLLGSGMGGVNDPVSALALFASVFGAVALAVTAWVLSAGATFTRYFGFRLTRVGDELRYERGLFQRYDGSIPLEKVQTVALRENVLQRRLGYTTVAVETAGYAPGQSPSGGSEAAVPLVTRERGVALARSIESFGELTFERPPKRARRRYAIRYVLALLGLAGVLWAANRFLGVPGFRFAPLVFLPLAPVAAHLKWASRGYHVGSEHVATRNGFWQRTITVVPYYRTQTIIESATIFQRRWGLASLVVDTAGTRSLLGQDAAAVDVARETAAELRDVVVAGLAESRRRRSAKRSNVSNRHDDSSDSDESS